MTLNGSLEVTHHFQGFVLEVFTSWPLMFIISIIKKANERNSFQKVNIPDAVTFGGQVQNFSAGLEAE